MGRESCHGTKIALDTICGSGILVDWDVEEKLI